MFFSQFDSNVPMVEEHTAVNCCLYLPCSFVALDSVLCKANHLESLGKINQKWVVFRNLSDDLREVIIVLHP